MFSRRNWARILVLVLLADICLAFGAYLLIERLF
jgi:hypothetical protein